MAAWKQLLLAIVILVAAAAAWARFFPGAPEILARWGIDWAQAATGVAGGGQASRAEGGPVGGGGPGNAGGQRRPGGGGAQASVVTQPVERSTINDRLSAIGTGRAKASVTVTPYTSGRLTEVLVASGAKIKAGDVIARLDSEAEEIELDRAKIAIDDAVSKLQRVNALRTSNTATAVQVTEAQIAASNAKLALRDAQLAFDRRSIVAPISGVVGILAVEAGNYITTQTTVATIDDRSRIVVDFWVPERYASAVAVGAPLTAVPIARPGEEFQGTVSAVDNRIDEASRTLLVRAELPNPDDTLRAGMSFQVAMRFAGDSYPSVNPLAIQWGSDGAFVWAVRDGKAMRTPVRIVQRNTDSVLVEAKIAPGDSVVTEGIHAVRDGAPVMVASREGTGGPPLPGARGGS